MNDAIEDAAEQKQFCNNLQLSTTIPGCKEHYANIIPLQHARAN